MPLPNVSDPVIREIVNLRRVVRRLVVGTFLLFIALATGLTIALALRANDLENQARQANEEQVRTCFRSASQRADLRRVSKDKELPAAIRDLLDTTIINLPTLEECRQQAGNLGVRHPRR